jgi:hypothetical protein
MTHIGETFLLWCNEDWGQFFDDPIVKEGIAVGPDGKFSNLENLSESYLKPSGPTHYLTIPTYNHIALHNGNILRSKNM